MSVAIAEWVHNVITVQINFWIQSTWLYSCSFSCWRKCCLHFYSNIASIAHNYLRVQFTRQKYVFRCFSFSCSVLMEKSVWSKFGFLAPKTRWCVLIRSVRTDCGSSVCYEALPVSWVSNPQLTIPSMYVKYDCILWIHVKWFHIWLFPTEIDIPMSSWWSTMFSRPKRPGNSCRTG